MAAEVLVMKLLIKFILKCNDKQNEEILQLFDEARQNGFEGVYFVILGSL